VSSRSAGAIGVGSGSVVASSVMVAPAGDVTLDKIRWTERLRRRGAPLAA
jgi:hypothetical protein